MPELDLGNVKGPQGKSAYQSALDAGYSGSEEAFNKAMAKAPDAVLYTAQSLSDTQKAQARGNINAAPGGFGLGDSTGQSILDANEAILGGFYYWGLNAKNTPFRYGAMVVIPRSSNTDKPDVTQIASEDTGDINPISYIAVRKSTDNGDGAWGEWEYVNPPMELGIEYRTTERYRGKPVYCKLVDFGKLPNNAVKIVAHGISNLQYAISVTGESNGDNLIGNMYITYVHIGTTNISIKTNADRSGVSATVLIKYTKTTD